MLPREETGLREDEQAADVAQPLPSLWPGVLSPGHTRHHGTALPPSLSPLPVPCSVLSGLGPPREALLGLPSGAPPPGPAALPKLALSCLGPQSLKRGTVTVQPSDPEDVLCVAPNLSSAPDPVCSGRVSWHPGTLPELHLVCGCLCVRACGYLCAHVHVFVRGWVSVHTHVCVRACGYLSAHVCVSVWVSVCVPCLSWPFLFQPGLGRGTVPSD